MENPNNSHDHQLNKIGKLLPFAAAFAVVVSAFAIYALRNSPLAPFVVVSSGALLLLYAFLAAFFVMSRKEGVPIRIRKR